MSYGPAAALQKAVFARLTGDATLTGLVGDAIFDAAPKGALPPIRVTLGPEEVLERDDKTGRGSINRFVVSVETETASFHAVKTAAAAAADALENAPLALERGHLVSLSFLRGRARHTRNRQRRRIDLTFRASIDDA